jgi:hypothetical protein
MKGKILPMQDNNISLKDTRLAWFSIAFGCLAFICVLAVSLTFPNHDGISVDLASTLIAPVQLVNDTSSQPIFKNGGFVFGEEEAIILSLWISVLSASVSLVLCSISAKKKTFTYYHGVAFLMSTASLSLIYFNFGFLMLDGLITPY